MSKIPALNEQEVAIDSTFKTILSTLCEEYLSKGKQIDELETRRQEIKKDVEDMVIGLPYDTIRGKTFSTSREIKTTKKINPFKLMEKGVSEEVIDYATDVKQSAPFVRISPIKEKKEEDNKDFLSLFVE